jgi:glycosyltransferase involved in cell wall biosynthesis
MQEKSTLNVLVSAFACGPNWGSEVGMGWNWITNLSQYSQLHVIAEKGFKEDIDKGISELSLKYPPKFYYLDIGEKGRRLFWKQGSLLFYYYYNKWQKAAYTLSKKILNDNQIQIIHQLNLIGFREPGYLWKYADKCPVLWGPVGGINQIPLNFIFYFNFKNILFYLGKNAIHSIQLAFSPRVVKALKNAKFVIAESSGTKEILKKKFGVQAMKIHETACYSVNLEFKEKNNKLIELIWIGKIQGTKALPIALRALSKVKEKEKFHLTIIGDGPDEKFCKRLVHRLDISNLCTFLGKIPNKDVIEKIKGSDLLFFTSLKEGTATVVIESLSFGIPVLCHDTCGFGDIVSSDNGIKIPLNSYKESVMGFAAKLSEIALDKSVLAKLSKGALKVSKNFNWESNAKKMFDLYINAIK